MSAVSNATKAKIVTARAYSSVHDTVSNVAKTAARFPKSNFTDVIPMELQKDKFQTLVIQAGLVDIKNLKTRENPAEHMEYFRQETVKSAQNIFNAALNALTLQPSLQKVVLMKQIPRYDPTELDPMELKPALSDLYNNTITTLWMNCVVKDKLYIGGHNISCTGSIRESRYRQTKTGKFDGIHLYGSSGQKAYTLSVLNILNFAKVTSSDYDFHQSCAQFQYQSRQLRNMNNKSNKKYNVGGHSGQNHTTYKQMNRPGYSAPTSSRFDILSDRDQGNF